MCIPFIFEFDLFSIGSFNFAAISGRGNGHQPLNPACLSVQDCHTHTRRLSSFLLGDHRLVTVNMVTANGDLATEEEEPPPHATFLQLLGVAIFLFLGPFFILLSFGLLLLSIYYQASWATVLLLL